MSHHTLHRRPMAAPLRVRLAGWLYGMLFYPLARTLPMWDTGRVVDVRARRQRS